MSRPPRFGLEIPRGVHAMLPITYFCLADEPAQGAGYDPLLVAGRRPRMYADDAARPHKKTVCSAPISEMDCGMSGVGSFQLTWNGLRRRRSLCIQVMFLRGVRIWKWSMRQPDELSQ